MPIEMINGHASSNRPLRAKRNVAGAITINIIDRVRQDKCNFFASWICLFISVIRDIGKPVLSV